MALLCAQAPKEGLTEEGKGDNLRSMAPQLDYQVELPEDSTSQSSLYDVTDLTCWCFSLGDSSCNDEGLEYFVEVSLPHWD